LIKNNYIFRSGCFEGAMPRRERDTLCLSGRHPNVATLEWAFETASYWILVLEYCDLGNLMRHVKRTGNPGLKVDEVARLGGQILQGLDHLHTHNILHRDVKPDNIGISGPLESPTAKLLDFGFAKRADTRQSSTIVGSYGYCAPELERARMLVGALRQNSEAFDERADIYAFGVALFVMYVGREADIQGTLWTHAQFREMLSDPHSMLWSCKSYRKLNVCGTTALTGLKTSGALQAISRLTATKRQNRPRTAALAGRLPFFKNHPGSVPNKWLVDDDGAISDDSENSFEVDLSM